VTTLVHGRRAGPRARLSLAAIAAAAALAGCGQLRAVRDRWDAGSVAALPANPDPQAAVLRADLLDLARSELGQADWRDGATFLALARRAAGGDLPPPTAPAERDVDADAAPELLEAYAELAGLLGTPGARLRAPAELGSLQAAYECWLEQAEEGHQALDIAACRDRYRSLAAVVREKAALPGDLAVVLPGEHGAAGGLVASAGGREVPLAAPFAAVALGAAGPSAVPVDEGEVRTAFAGALAARPIPPRTFVLLFGEGSAVLRPEALAVVEAVAADVARRAAAEVVVEGHADRVGSPAANERLARRRARAVAEAVRRRAAGGRVTVAVAAEGERRPAVETADGLAEPLNRRVTVLIR
jgi:OmpA-OmpF porin, OOP family